jgi:polyisoprenyl-phosphate glycosyltransferase
LSQSNQELKVAISVVTPVYKAAECLEELYRRLVKALEVVVDRFEIILVNDGSPDDSWSLIQGLARRDPRVRGLNLSRNFGQHYAISAGLDHVRGDYVVVMDCDLQHLPEDIPRLYRKALEGHDIVLLRRVRRFDSRFRIVASRLFVWLYNLLSDVKVDPSISSFSIISRRVVMALRSLQECNRTYTLLLHWVGFDPAYIDGDHAERFAGKSAYSLAKAVNIAIEGISSQSNRPLRLSIQFGFFLSVASLLYALWLAIKYFVSGVAVPGWTSVMVSMFFLSGLLFANIGVLGLYLGKVYDAAKKRPLYLVKERLNFGPPERVEASDRIAKSIDTSLPQVEPSVRSGLSPELRPANAEVNPQPAAVLTAQRRPDDAC